MESKVSAHLQGHGRRAFAAVAAAAFAFCLALPLAASGTAYGLDDDDDLVTEEEWCDTSDWDLDDSYELAEGYIEEILYEDIDTGEDDDETLADSILSTLVDYGLTKFTGTKLQTYTDLKEFITDIAENGGTTTVTVTFDDYYNSGSTSLSDTKEDFDLSTIVWTLMYDSPYEFYWFDKTQGYSYSFTYSTASDGTYNLKKVKINFYPSDDYVGSSTYSVTTPASKVSTAKTNAQAIVDEYADTTKVKTKLTAYKDEICDLVTYNDDAADDDDYPYGDPWQLIYVFDGDSSTNVVCEGYSKAFQYLCDLTWPDNYPVICYTVSGYTTYNSSTGAHMWNLIEVDDCVYLVDVTNCDDGCIGDNGELFLVYDSSDVSGSYTSGYTISYTRNSKTYTIKYAYKDMMFDIYTSEELTLGTTALSSTRQAIDITSATVTLSSTSYTYTGSAITPTVIVKIGSATLGSGTAYTVEYSDNTDAGTATVTVTGTGSYYGTITTTFTIGQRSISYVSRSLDTSTYTYDGTAHEPTVTLTYNSMTLVQGTDYTLSYSNNTDAGTGTVTVTCMGNYKGSVSLSFTIEPASISGATVTLSKSSYTYSGDANEPTVTVRLTLNGSSTKLTSGTDYTVSYSDNVDAGTATVTVTGTGNFTDTATKTFTINALSLASGTLTLDETSYVYDGTSKEPGTTVVVDDTTLVLGTDYTVAYSDNVAAGTATATVTGTGNYTGTLSATFKIITPDISEGTLELDAYSYEYAAGAIEPGTTVVVSGITLTAGTDYTVEYSNNVNIGTATVTVTGIGSYTGTLTATFTITVCDLSGATVSVDSFTYDGASHESVPTVVAAGATLVEGVDYTYSYIGDTVNAGTVYVVVTALSSNYTGSCTGEYTISKRVMAYTSISLDESSCEYTGSAITVGVTLTYNGMTLVEGTDYTLAYYDNTDTGTATVTATGTGNYSGTKSGTFTITAASVENATVSLSDTSFTYDGTAKEPDVTLTYNGLTLEEGTDYTLAYSDNVDAGTATVTVTGTGNFTDAATKTFTIAKASISSATVTLDETTYTYSGSAYEPEVTVVLDGTTLVEDTAYTLEYSDNVNAGTATATVTGTGNYTGTVTASFTIDPLDLSDASIRFTLPDGEDAFYYTGYEILPDLRVTVDGVDLTAGTDYTTYGVDNVDAGWAVIYVVGTGNYTGTASKDLPIQARWMRYTTAELEQDAYEYDGTAKEPGVTVTYNGFTLVEDTDYTVEYSDNVEIGTATVTLTGMGNFKYTKTLEFTISEKLLTGATVTLSQSSYDYTGSACEPTPTVVLDGVTLEEGTDYTVSYSDNVDAGTATVTITGAGNYGGTLTQTFTIETASLSGATVTLSGTTYTYSGEANAPTTTVVLDGVTLEEGTDYTVSYSDNTDVGTATVTITGAGNYEGTVSTTFEVVARSIASGSVELSPSSYTYSGDACEPDVILVVDSNTLTLGTDYTVSYEDNVDAGTATVTMTGIGNYTGTATATFAIDAASLDGVSLASARSACTYDGTAKEPGIVATYNGVTLVEGVDYTLSYSDNVEIGTATITVTGIGNYSGTSTVTFEITEKTSIEDGECTLEGTVFEYDGSSQEPAVVLVVDGVTLTEGTDYTVTYSDNVEAGTATVTIEGIGDYTGTMMKTFQIDPVDLEDAAIALSQESYTYDGTAKVPGVTVTRNGTTLVEGTDYTLAYSDNVDAGTAYVTVTGIGNCEGTVECGFKIGVDFVELYGTNRYGTMQAIVSYAFGDSGSDYAVVATGANFPDALAAASLAGVLDAPVILVNDKTAADAVEQLQELGVSGAYIIGGTSAVSSSIESAIQKAGIVTERVYGSNRFATARAIADKVLELTGSAASDTCIVASGMSFPDALSGSPYSYWSESPIYLAGKNGTVDSATLEAIEEAGYTRIIVLGGESAVSASSFKALSAIDGASVERVGGANRYETSAKMAEWSVAEGMSYDGATIATGTEFPDALAGASLCGSNGSVILLAGPTVEKSATMTSALESCGEQVNRIYVLGGYSAVSDAVREAVKALY